ncbi:MAG: ribosome silencing factor [Bacteroidales bacterium]|nr:ribosome silencing factor [Bacteroidales bacterium]MDT8431075.1 ribosome silencing factor [Bacteroidales bacterium]
MTETEEARPGEMLGVILDALKEKKGKDIVTIDLREVENAICDHFVICQGNSTTQVDALSDSVHRKVKKELNTAAHHVEGKNNSLWVLMDYSDIVVHIFLEEQRTFYNLEDVWADGVLSRIDDDL